MLPRPIGRLLFSTGPLLATLTRPLVQADDLQPLGDEFGNAATFSRYQEHGALEGWGPTHVESADINTSSPGNFRIVPRTTGWYEHLRGTHFSKNVSGDFIATAHVFVYRRQNGAGPLAPSVRLFSLDGILVRAPQIITTLTIDDASFDHWRFTHFAAQANAPEGQPGADFDSDGGTNLVEFALGGSPTQPDLAAFQPVNGEDGGRLTLSFTPAAASSSVILRVEARADLVVGTWLPLAHRPAGAGAWMLDDPAAVVSVAPGTGRVTVSDAVPINGGGKRFLSFSVDF